MFTKSPASKSGFPFIYIWRLVPLSLFASFFLVFIIALKCVNFVEVWMLLLQSPPTTETFSYNSAKVEQAPTIPLLLSIEALYFQNQNSVSILWKIRSEKLCHIELKKTAKTFGLQQSFIIQLKM